jgi:hypothetical protein
MSEKPEDVRERDAALEREVRSDRKFSLGEAIGRMAGGGLMKGASPVTRKQQILLEIQEFLSRHLIDAGGALRVVLLRRVGESDLVLGDMASSQAVLAEFIRRVLGSEYRLEELVRETDVEWGRIFGERPYFQTDGRSSDPDDPYTFESVRALLKGLLEPCQGPPSAS